MHGPGPGEPSSKTLTNQVFANDSRPRGAAREIIATDRKTLELARESLSIAAGLGRI